MSEVDLFERACRIADPKERNSFLDEACQSNPELRQSLDRLLTKYFAGKDFLGESTHDPIAAVHGRPHPASGLESAANFARDEDVQEALELLAPAKDGQELGWLDHHRVKGVLGRGQFGVVFKATDSKLNRDVAIKMMLPKLAATSPARKRFLREAQAAAQIRDENVVQVYSIGETPIPYLVMEYVAGETLQARIHRTGPLDSAIVLRLAIQMASGLTAAHASGIVHRDIKPANILLEGELGGRVKITDLGLARIVDDASMTQSGNTAGTPLYMSPEQALGDAVDHRSDLFSLGSTLYAVLTGHSPFRAPTITDVLRRVVLDTPRPLREIIPETPDWLVTIVAKLHEKDPGNRIQTARELTELLKQCQGAIDRRQDPSSLPEIKALASALDVARETSWARSGSLTANPWRHLTSNWRNTALAVGAIGIGVAVWNPGFHDARQKVENRMDVPANDATSAAAHAAADRRSTADYQAAEWILRLGGIVSIRGQGREVEQVYHAPLPIYPFELVSADIRGHHDFKNEHLQQLARCHSLKELIFQNVTNLSDRGLDLLAGLKIERLILSGTPRLTDGAGSTLGTFTELKFLRLETNGLRDSVIPKLAPLSNLYRLDLYESRMSDACLGELATACPQLVELGVRLNPPLTFQGVSQFPHLGLLQLRGPDLTRPVIEVINRTPSLQFVNIESPLTDDVLLRLKDLTRVHAIQLSGTPTDSATVTPEIYERLVWPPLLSNFAISGRSIAPTDSGLRAIAKIPTLKLFSLHCRHVPNSQPPYTREGIERIRSLRPEVQIIDAVPPGIADHSADSARNADETVRAFAADPLLTGH